MGKFEDLFVDDNKVSTDDLFKGIPAEGDNEEEESVETTDTTEVETPSEEPKPEVKAEEVEEVKEEPKQVEPEKDLPFHKNPRFKRLHEENEALKLRLDQLEQKVAEPPKETPKEIDQVPEQYKHLFGEDAQAYKAWLTFQTTENQRVAEEVYAAKEKARLDAESARKDFEKKFVEKSEESLADLSEQTGWKLTDQDNTQRNQLLDIIEEFNFYDKDGFLDFDRALKAHKKMYPAAEKVESPNKEVAKKLAPGKAAASKVSDVMTPSKLKAKRYEDYFKS